MFFGTAGKGMFSKIFFIFSNFPRVDGRAFFEVLEVSISGPLIAIDTE